MVIMYRIYVQSVNIFCTLFLMLAALEVTDKIKGMKTKKIASTHVDAKYEGEYLKARMHELGHNPSSLAKALGVSRTTLYDVFAGKYALTRELVARFNELDKDLFVQASWQVSGEWEAIKRLEESMKALQQKVEKVNGKG